MPSLATAPSISVPKYTLVLLAGHNARQVSTGVAFAWRSIGKPMPSHRRTQKATEWPVLPLPRCTVSRSRGGGATRTGGGTEVLTGAGGGAGRSCGPPKMKSRSPSARRRIRRGRKQNNEEPTENHGRTRYLTARYDANARDTSQTKQPGKNEYPCPTNSPWAELFLPRRSVGRPKNLALAAANSIAAW